MSLTRQNNERIRKEILEDIRGQIAKRKDHEVTLFSISHGYDDALLADVLWTIITEYKQTSTIVALHENPDKESTGYVYTSLNNNYSTLPIIRETKPIWYAIEANDKPNRLFTNNNRIDNAYIQALIN